MIHELDNWAHVNRWQGRVAENSFLALGLLALAMLLPPFPGGPLVMATSIAAATAGAGIPLSVILRISLIPCLFLIVGTVPMLVEVHMMPGGGLAVAWSRPGMVTAAHTGMRALGATEALILLASTTSVPDLMGGLRKVRVPEVLIEMATIIYRFLFMLDATIYRMVAAQSGRLGYRDLRTGFRSAAMAISVLFGRTWQRAQDMEAGLTARGYRGTLRVLDRRSARTWDRKRMAVIALTHLFLAVICALYWRWTND